MVKFIEYEVLFADRTAAVVRMPADIPPSHAVMDVIEEKARRHAQTNAPITDCVAIRLV